MAVNDFGGKLRIATLASGERHVVTYDGSWSEDHAPHQLEWY